MLIKKGFGSDNHSGVHPKILEHITKSNYGHMPSYGTDEICEQANLEFKKHFGEKAETYFVFNGTAANTLSLAAMCKPYQGVFCSDVSHIYNDECGAPEVIARCKLFPIKSVDGKISPEQIEENIVRMGDQHATQPKVISLTQPTELGTVYTLKEIKAISALTRKHNLYLHIDGARLPNACVHLSMSFKEITTELGVDVVSFGGTKNGLMFGEAIVFLNQELAKDFKYTRKQFMQLPSKSRFIASQFLGFFENNLWETNSKHTLALAQKLYTEVKDIPYVKVMYPVESNAVFATIPKEMIKPLRESYFFYVWDEKTFECRWMISFDNTEEEIIDFAKRIRNFWK